jgi:hypothetical protein
VDAFVRSLVTGLDLIGVHRIQDAAVVVDLALAGAYAVLR